MFDFIWIHYTHEQGQCERSQIFFTFKTEYDFAPGIRHDGFIDLCAICAGMKNLAGKLVGERQMKAESNHLNF